MLIFTISWPSTEEDLDPAIDTKIIFDCVNFNGFNWLNKWESSRFIFIFITQNAKWTQDTNKRENETTLVLSWKEGIIFSWN